MPAMLPLPPSAHSMLATLRSYSCLHGSSVTKGPALLVPISSSCAMSRMSQRAVPTPSRSEVSCSRSTGGITSSLVLAPECSAPALGLRALGLRARGEGHAALGPP